MLRTTYRGNADLKLALKTLNHLSDALLGRSLQPKWRV